MPEPETRAELIDSFEKQLLERVFPMGERPEDHIKSKDYFRQLRHALNLD